MSENCSFKIIHPEYKIVGFDGTGRVYSSNPSLSQIPKVLRHAIIPHEGNKFFYVDIAQAEFYILVKWAKCESLIDAYESGEDLYTHVAQKIFNKDGISGEERDTMKAVILSILYGSEGNSAARALHIETEEAKSLVEKFMSTYPEIAKFQERAYKFTVDNGYTQSFYFRPRILKESVDDGDLSRKRQCVNNAIQNTCSDALKMCIRELGIVSQIKFVTTVFDSVLFEVPKEFTDEEAKNFLTHFFSHCYPFKFRFEYAMGDTWGDAQDQL